MNISVYLADDNLLIREGVKTLISMEDDLDVVGVASDYDELIAGASEANPQVFVTDIRMPPNFTREGIDAAKEVRKIHPGTGIVILSQYDDPEYAISLLSEGAAGYASGQEWWPVWIRVPDGQWYRHLFDVTQPDLNLGEPRGKG